MTTTIIKYSDEDLLEFKEIILKKIASDIESTVKKDYNYINKENFIEKNNTLYKEVERKKNFSFLPWIFNLLLILLVSGLFFKDKTIPFLQNILSL